MACWQVIRSELTGSIDLGYGAVFCASVDRSGGISMITAEDQFQGGCFVLM